MAGLGCEIVAACASLAFEGEEVAFDPPEDVVLAWAKRAGLSVIVFSWLLILFVLIARRRRLMEPQSKWLLFLGLCVLPVPVAFLSGGVGMEESKSVGFCNSCHEPMGPFVDDMLNPNSENLAAVHFKNRLIQTEQCWKCHSDYGIAGATQAKLSGLNHISKVAFDSWEPPVKLRGNYSWSICLGCHGDSARFRGEESHEEVLAGIREGKTGCTDCHETAHPPREERSSK